MSNPAGRPITPVAVGERYGLLVILGEAERRGDVRRIDVRCDCGVEKTMDLGAMLSRSRQGRLVSCGCRTPDAVGDARRSHGESGTKLYRLWAAIKTRCTNRRSEKFRRYGKRGIAMHPAWRRSYETFRDWIVKNLGEPKPDKWCSLDRIDNDGDYAPGNVRWADPKTQRRNQPGVVTITHNGETLHVSDWAERTGISATTIARRIKLGWPVADALRFKPHGRVRGV